MTHRSPAIALVMALASAPAGAQTTWIVDASNGPGTHYTDLPPAVAAAAAGDRIVVRDGQYTGVKIDKPLAIVGGANAAIALGAFSAIGLQIENVPAGSTLTITGLAIRLPSTAGPASLSAANCAGSLVLDEVSVLFGDLQLNGCADVRMRSCSVLRGGRVIGGTAALDRCTMGGWGQAFSSTPALLVRGAHVTASRCRLTGFGPTGTLQSPPSAALELDNASVLLTGDGSGVVAAGASAAGSTPAIDGAGTLDLDPHVVLLPSGGAPAIAAGVAVSTRPIPSLAADGAPPGGSVQIELFGTPGDPYALFVGLPAPSLPLPWLGGRLWLQPVILAGGGTLDARGRGALPVPVPAHASLTGSAWTWQGVTLGAVAGVALSSPATYALGM